MTRSKQGLPEHFGSPFHPVHPALRDPRSRQESIAAQRGPAPRGGEISSQPRCRRSGGDVPAGEPRTQNHSTDVGNPRPNSREPLSSRSCTGLTPATEPVHHQGCPPAHPDGETARPPLQRFRISPHDAGRGSDFLLESANKLSQSSLQRSKQGGLSGGGPGLLHLGQNAPRQTAVPAFQLDKPRQHAGNTQLPRAAAIDAGQQRLPGELPRSGETTPDPCEASYPSPTTGS